MVGNVLLGRTLRKVGSDYSCIQIAGDCQRIGGVVYLGTIPTQVPI